MNNYTLKTYTENKPIFSGHYHSFIDCLEDAVKKNINLSHIDLRAQNLTNANLDGAHMPFADFKGANLIGCNLSECELQNSIFNDCVLYNTCFAYSEIKNSMFMGASFGATIIDGSNIQDCTFSTLSAFDLEFQTTRAMSGCRFIDPDFMHHDMSQPPVILKGIINTPIIILDKSIKIGGQYFASSDALPSVQSLIQKVLPQTVNQEYFKKVTG